jgi:F-type H+-transporting ATPase subunit b
MIDLLHHAVVFADETPNNFFYGKLDEVIVSGLASVIVIGLLIWKGLPAARGMATARTERISKEIGDASKAHTDAQQRLDEVRQRIANAENERQRILVEARQTAEALKTQIVARAEDEATAIGERATADVESSKAQAAADLQAEVATLALGAAEAVVTRNLDAATQSELIDTYIDQLAESAGAR